MFPTGLSISKDHFGSLNIFQYCSRLLYVVLAACYCIFRKVPLMIIPAKSLLPNHAIFQQVVQADGHSSYLIVFFPDVSNIPDLPCLCSMEFILYFSSFLRGSFVISLKLRGSVRDDACD